MSKFFCIFAQNLKHMATYDLVKLFDQTKIRVVWDDEQEKYYFSVVDVVGVLAESADYQLALQFVTS